LGAGFGALHTRMPRARPSRLRPPGAGGEQHFLSACIRCGQCVDACPHDSLQLASLSAGLECGAPAVDSRLTPCELCPGEEDLLCIEACPTTALQPVEDLRDIRMGVAIIDRDRCLAWQGTACRSCWHICPFPNEAIRLDWRTRAEIVAEVCIGCGLCDRACLTEPSSIEIIPRAAFAEGDLAHRGAGKVGF